jgi:hypothetical protein
VFTSVQYLPKCLKKSSKYEQTEIRQTLRRKAAFNFHMQKLSSAKSMGMMPKSTSDQTTGLNKRAPFNQTPCRNITLHKFTGLLFEDLSR